MNHLTVETDDSFSSLLDLAANNDIAGLNRSIQRDASAVDDIGLWYGRQKGSKQMVLEHRTPLMVAAMYGSVDVLKFILSLSGTDVNRSCGPDKSTALHCAASGGSVNAVEVVKLLLLAGADPNSMDANGRFPINVIVVSPKLSYMKIMLEELLTNNGSTIEHNLRISIPTSNSISSSSPDNGSPSSDSNSNSPPMDIKNSIYATDEFRMYSFKVRPCSRAYSHDWTECPFVHPGENARRRDLRKFHYSCVPCPDFRKGTTCRRGDLCEYAHGVFECWLHPAQYRTRLCKDGTSCMRRVCFFAHMSDELRPLYVSTGSAVPSPHSTAASAMELAAAMSLLPGSPSSMSVLSPSPFTPPMSPSANNMSHSAWPQPNAPTLDLPGSNLQSSRLRSSLNARDIQAEDYMQQQLLNELSCFPSFVNRSVHSKTLAPSNLDDLYTPRYSDQSASPAVFSPSHKSAVLNQFQKQQQSMLSPINTNPFSPKNVDHHLLQTSFGAPSPGRMSPRSMEPISPINSRLSVFSQREKHQQHLHSLSSRDLGSNTAGIIGSPVSNWSKWGSPNGKLDWAVHGDELSQLQKPSSFEMGNNGEEPDVSWVQSLVKESPPEIKDKLALPIQSSGSGTSVEGIESTDYAVLGALLEQMQLDQLVA